MQRLLVWAEGLMAMDDDTWARHASGWSVWTRIATPLPLLALAIWSRAWIGWGALLPLAVVCAWIWLNPRLFSAPATFESWPARAVLGERVLLRHPTRVPHHHRRPLQFLTLISGVGILPFAYGLWAYDIGFTCLGIVLIAGGKTWFCDRTAWVWDDVSREGMTIADLRKTS